MAWNAFKKASLTAVLAVLVAACGDGYDDGASAAPAPEQERQSQRRVKLAALDGAQETPAVGSGAFGAGVLAVERATGRLGGFVVTSGLVEATAAHIHLAPRGTPGSVIVPLSGGPELWVVPDDAQALTPAQVTAFEQDELYFNVHTRAHPDGEIRGQLDKAGTLRLSSLNGAQETPPVSTQALGGGLFAVDEATGEVSGFVVASGLPGTAAHVHEAARGTPGGIIVPLAGGPELWVVPDRAAPLGEAQRAAFGRDGLFYNVHTAANPNGEIRGQLDKTGTLRLAALDGAQEAPPVTTPAFGAGVLAVDAATGEASGFVVAAKIPTGNAAHVHAAPRGTPGSIIVPMIGAGELWVISDDAGPIGTAERAAFDRNGLYYNVHTPAHPDGEIRGQLGPEDGSSGADGTTPGSGGTTPGPGGTTPGY